MDTLNKQPQLHHAKPRSFLLLILVSYVLVWSFSVWLFGPSLDGYGDMVENYAWGQTWIWGSFKHPPLISWVVKIWFAVFPENVMSYFMLSYFNAALGVVGLLAIGSLWVPEKCAVAKERFFVVMILLAVLGAPYSNLAAKFNADTILLSLWPWTTYTFFRAVQPKQRSFSLLWSVLLGVFAALAMLGKYYSGVLLLSFALVTLLCPQYWRWYKTPYPYLSVLTFAVALWPHAQWEMNMNFPFMQYLEQKVDAGIQLKRVLTFFASCIYYFPLTWLGYWGFKSYLSVEQEAPIKHTIPLKPLALMVVLPALITIVCHFVLHIHLTTHWAIPIWFVLPVLLSIKLLPSLASKRFTDQLIFRVLSVWAAVIITLSAIYAFYLSYHGEAQYTFSRQEMVKKIQARFDERFPDAVLGWVGGDWPEPASVAFFSPDHPIAIPQFPNQMPGLVNPHLTWHKEYGALLCVSLDNSSKAETVNHTCKQAAEKWLGDNDMPLMMDKMSFQANGWRYLKPVPKIAIIYWLTPQ